jgi:hypothetical protein
MNEALTLTSIGQLLAVVTVFATLWWRVETRISKGSVDAMDRANAAIAETALVKSQLNDHKLEVAENYAKNGYLKDVEARIISHISSIVLELHGIREDLKGAMIEVAKSKVNTRGRS